ncbi:uncharacterized protein LOC142338583 isoform X2 [Convolutriloba macropyga]|uniref:uncharacterized protein LOC142338583 isoform X2 n=1 Tax=Convolutriloba macropyga TaxID=536237 RepID=UPI003F524487
MATRKVPKQGNDSPKNQHRRQRTTNYGNTLAEGNLEEPNNSPPLQFRQLSPQEPVLSKTPAPSILRLSPREGSKSLPNFSPQIKIEAELDHVSSAQGKDDGSPHRGNFSVRFEDEVEKIERDLASRRSTVVPTSELSSESANAANDVPALPRSSRNKASKAKSSSSWCCCCFKSQQRNKN